MYTLQQLESRHSVRSYAAGPLPEKAAKAVKAAISDVNSHLSGLRFQLITDDATPFSGSMGSYGIFRNVSNYVAAVVDTGIAEIAEIAGFAGQQVVMAASSAGLGTCFIGGTFDASKLPVQLRAGEKTLFIIALGAPADGNRRILERLLVATTHRKDRKPADFFDADKSGITLSRAVSLYPALREALAAVACAPSAMNKQPVRIWIDSERDIHACVASTSGFNPIDLGIAKFNFSQIIPGEWLWGNNARFLPDEPAADPYS